MGWAIGAYHSVPTIKIPGRASLRNARQLLKLKTALGWKPPHVAFCLCIEDIDVTAIKRKNAHQYVMESATGQPSMPSEV